MLNKLSRVITLCGVLLVATIVGCGSTSEPASSCSEVAWVNPDDVAVVETIHRIHAEIRYIRAEDYGFKCGDVDAAGCTYTDYSTNTCTIFLVDPTDTGRPHEQVNHLAVLGHEIGHCYDRNWHDNLDATL